MHEQQPEQERPGLPAGAADQPERDTRSRPQIYVADLAAYNNGVLFGRWLDAAREEDALQTDIAAMLAESPVPGAEEWAIHDYEGFGSLRLAEYEPLATISRLACGIAEHGTAFAALADWLGTDQATEDTFANHYRGSWPRVEDYAENLLEELGAWDYLDQAPEWLRPYTRIDVEGFARDLELGGDIYAAEDGTQVHIFDGHA